jgi:hypothetical protein
MNQDHNDNNFLGRNGFYYFFGIVEDRDDPLTLGRIKVRVFGTHPDDKTLVPTEDLPWAMPIQPINSAAAHGVGHSPVGPIPGTHVFGFWADGRDCQIPFILGTIAGGTGQFNYGVPQQDSLDGQIGSSPVGPNGAPINLPKGSKAIPQRAATFSKLIQDRYKLTDYQACALIGNLWHESGGFRAIREYGKGSGPQDQPPPKGTKNTGYGWVQWTNSRLDDFLNFCDLTAHPPQSDEANLGFFLKELDKAKVIRGLKTNAPVTVSGYWAGTYDCSNIEGATRYVMAEYERPKKGLDHIGERIQYAKMTLVAMNKTSVPQSGAPSKDPNAQVPTNNNPKAQ